VPSAAATLRSQLDAITAIANSPRRDRGATRAIYSYPAKFQAHLPAELIRLFTRPGDLVVDPFAGGGTTGLEAFLLGRRFFGVDLNPFACLVARVKTTRIDRTAIDVALATCLAAATPRPVLDDDDRLCLGPAVAAEVDRLAGGTDAVADPAARDLLRVALVHAVKIAGRRDFDSASLLPHFEQRVAVVARAAAALPDDRPAPAFRCGSNHALPEVDAGAARLVVTSPPYKDLDVEYGLLQIQRPALGKSKRSRVIWRLLEAPELGKSRLCGGRGEAYWPSLDRSLAALRGVLAPGAAAFFWTGFKTFSDEERFMDRLAAAGLEVVAPIRVVLGRDRVASSRSTHHGRDTGMMGHDYLIACLAK
jgi:hypothetical protein